MTNRLTWFFCLCEYTITTSYFYHVMHLNLLEQYLIAHQKWSTIKCENHENYTETDITIFIFAPNTIVSYDN